MPLPVDKKRQSELHQHDHEVFDRAGSVDRDVEHGRSGGDELIIGNFPQYDPNEYDPRDHAGDYYDQGEGAELGWRWCAKLSPARSFSRRISRHGRHGPARH